MATGCAFGLLATGCSFDPIREVQPPPREPVTEPGALAFDQQDAPAEATSSTSVSPTSTPLDTVPAATWVVGSGYASLSIYSGPDEVFTRVGELSADDAVLATGRRVDAGDTIWMEISWDDMTAWVNETALAPSGNDS